MTKLICERLVFLTPSIENLLLDPKIQCLCVSPICITRPYLKCCYISFKNFLLEILEVIDIDLAMGFAFFEEAKNLSKTLWVGTGLCSEDLDASLNYLNRCGVKSNENYISYNSSYSKGYKHRSTSLDLRWHNRVVYVSEYDPQFYQEREAGISIDIEKKLAFMVPNTEVIEPHIIAPNFLTIKNSLPEIQIVSDANAFCIKKIANCSTQNHLQFDWIALRM